MDIKFGLQPLGKSLDSKCLGTRCCREYSDLREGETGKRIRLHKEKHYDLSLFFSFLCVIKSRYTGPSIQNFLDVKIKQTKRSGLIYCD